MNDFIDIQERPSLGKLLPLSFQHLFAMFGSTVLVPYLLSRSSNGIIYEWYWYIAVLICM